MSILKYYISTEYPVELSNELKDHVSIYSKRKSNNKLIILKELDYININIRNLLKNNFVYEVEFEKTNGWYQYYEKYNSYGNIKGSYAVDESVMGSPEKAAEKLKEKYEYYPSTSGHSRLDGYTFKNSD